LVIAAAAPADVVTCAVTGVRTDEAKLSVRAPTVPAIARFVHVALPCAFVCASTVPCSVPPPALIEAVTVTPAVVTEFECVSCNCTTGCVANATRFCAVVLGGVINASFATGPATPVAVNVTGVVTPAAVAVIAFAPATVPSVQLPAVATPSAFVTAVPPPVPPPDVTANVTLTSGTGLPSEVVTFTLGRALNATGSPATELKVVDPTAVTLAGTRGAVLSPQADPAAITISPAYSRARDSDIFTFTKGGNWNLAPRAGSVNRDLAEKVRAKYRLHMLSDEQIREKGLAHIARFGADVTLSSPVILKDPDGHFYKVIRPYSAKSTNLVSPFFVDRASGEITSISAGDVMPGVVNKLWGWAAMRADPALQKAVIDPDFSRERDVEVWSAIVREIMAAKGAKAVN
jgi:hypothetical protein